MYCTGRRISGTLFHPCQRRILSRCVYYHMLVAVSWCDMRARFSNSCAYVLHLYVRLFSVLRISSPSSRNTGTATERSATEHGNVSSSSCPHVANMSLDMPWLLPVVFSRMNATLAVANGIPMASKMRRANMLNTVKLAQECLSRHFQNISIRRNNCTLQKAVKKIMRDASCLIFERNLLHLFRII